MTSYEPRDQRHHRALAGTGRAHQRQRLARLDHQAHAGEHVTVRVGAGDHELLHRRDRRAARRRIAERDVAELDPPRRLDEVDRAWAVGDRLRRVEHLEHALERHHRRHQVDARVGEPGQRLVHARDQRRQRDERAARDVAADDELCADAVDRRRAERGHQSERDEEHAPEHRRANAGVAHGVGALAEHRVLPIERAEQLDQRRAGDVEALGHLRVHRRVVLHLLAGDVLQPPPHPARRHDEQRQHDQRQQRQPPLQPQHRDQRRDQHDHVAHDAPERARHRRLGADHVAVEAARDRARRRAREERQRQPLDLGEQRTTQVGDQPLADPCAAPALPDLEEGVAERGDDREAGQPPDLGAVALRDRVVEDLAHDQRRHQRQQRGDQDHA